MITCKWASCLPKLGAPMAVAYTVATRMKLRKNSHPNVIPGHRKEPLVIKCICCTALQYVMQTTPRSSGGCQEQYGQISVRCCAVVLDNEPRALLSSTS